MRLELACAVLVNWSVAPESTRERLLGLERTLLERAIGRVAGKEPGATARWLCEHPGWAAPGLLTPLVLGADRDASGVAAGLLVGRVLGALGIGGAELVGERLAKMAAGEGTPGELPALVERVGELVLRFEEHQQRDIMTMGLLLAEGPGRATGGALGSIASVLETEHGASTGMRAAIRRGTAPIVRARAWRWLASDAVRVAAIDRVSRAATAMEHELVLGDGYLVLRPGRARSLRMIKVRGKSVGGRQEAAGGEAVPSPVVRDRLGAVARRWLIDFSGAMQVPEAVGAGLRGAGLTDRSDWVRWAHQRGASAGELADYAFDRDVRVARAAALGRSPAGGCAWMRWPLRRADEVRLRMTDHLTRSPHEHVRSIARGDARRMNPWLVQCAESRLAAREWLRADREGFVGALRDRLVHGDERVRVDGIRLARLLRLGVSLEPMLIEMATSDGSGCRAAATAVAALGDLSTPSARAGVVAALSAGDVRVRANAVEASTRGVSRAVDLAEADTGLYGSLLELKSDGHHRVRANALRGLIEGCGTGRGGRVLDSSGVDGLELMLSDEREMHRLAGLWLAERTLVAGGRVRLGDSWDGLCRRIAAMAVRDEGEAVRTRALRCAKRLLAEIRVGSRGVEIGAGHE